MGFPQGCDWHGRDYDTINQIMWDNEDDWPEAAHRSPLWWLLNHHSKAFEDAIQTASTRMKQLAVVAQRIAEIAGSTR